MTRSPEQDINVPPVMIKQLMRYSQFWPAGDPITSAWGT
jgi:hypothetical protein